MPGPRGQPREQDWGPACMESSLQGCELGGQGCPPAAGVGVGRRGLLTEGPWGSPASLGPACEQPWGVGLRPGTSASPRGPPSPPWSPSSAQRPSPGAGTHWAGVRTSKDTGDPQVPRDPGVGRHPSSRPSGCCVMALLAASTGCLALPSGRQMPREHVPVSGPGPGWGGGGQGPPTASVYPGVKQGCSRLL